MEVRACLLVCACVCVGGVVAQVASLCRPNERFLSCGGCQKTCEDPAPACAAVCRTGCYCNDDEVRNKTGHCIKLADCPSTYNCEDINEEYVCRYGCEAHCDARPCLVRPRRCQLGCHCRLGLLRDASGRCLTQAECQQMSSLLVHDRAVANFENHMSARTSVMDGFLQKMLYPLLH